MIHPNDIENLHKGLVEPPKVIIHIDSDGVRLNKPEGIRVEIWKRSKDVEGWDHVKTLGIEPFNNIDK